MVRNEGLRDHVAQSILESAAAVLGDHGDATMADVAQAAGVGRATLYRYFPSREDLLHALTEAAVAELGGRIADARLDTIPFEEAIARVTRALFATASLYRGLLHGDKPSAKSPELRDRTRGPLLGLFRRGATEGALRSDLDADLLFEAYVGLVEGVLRRALHERVGVEDTSAMVTAVFLYGALPAEPR